MATNVSGQDAAREDQGPVILGATLTVTIAALITMVTRLYVRIHMIRNVGWDDYVMISAMVLCIAGQILIIPEVYYGAGPDLSLRHLPGQNLRRFFPVAHRGAPLLQTSHYRHHGLYGILHHLLLLHDSPTVHESGRAMGSHSQGHMLERVHDQDAELRQRRVEHHDRRAVLRRHPSPTTVERADEQAPEIFTDVHPRPRNLPPPS
ncbi:hypothetical protein OPT61_g7681 [Boeremia exigua]|uniref:Uncharacterized protein n=1 Tax=Boeremia exigua TaxID=749465 RepID=A0ACC2I1L8_9PLEO|nr:hypothetical protein OPT61_g7681 [Boeremia exigua]